MAEKASSAFGNVLLLTAVGIVSQVIAFVYRIALSRLIGAEVLGIYQLIMPVYAVLLSLSAVGLSTAVSYLSARLQAVGDFRGVWQLRLLALRLFFLLAILPCGVILSVSDGISVLILGDARTQLGLLLLLPCLLLTGIENVQKHYFYGTGHVKPAALTELAEQVIRSVLVLWLLYIFLPCSPEKAVGLIVLGMILCEIFSAAAQTILLRRQLSPGLRLRGEGKSRGFLLRETARIAVPVAVTALLGNLMGAASSILIPRLLVRGGMEFGEAMEQFGVMFGMTIPLLFLPMAFLGSLNLVLAPRLAASASLGRMERVRGQMRRSFSAVNVLLIGSLTLLAVMGLEIGPILYGDARVGQCIGILAAGVLFNCWEGLLASCLGGLGCQAAAARIALLADGIQLAITALTVGHPALGLKGAAWAYALGGLVGAFLSWRRLSRETALSLAAGDWLLLPLLGAAFAGICGKLLFAAAVGEGFAPMTAGLLCLGCGGALYGLALQAMGISLKGVFFGEKKMLARLWKRR